MRRRLGILSVLALLSACAPGDGSSGPSTNGSAPPRTFRMGFSAFPPSASDSLLLASLDLWTRRADAAIMHISVPYGTMLSGTSATDEVMANQVPLANYFKAKNLQLFVTLDVTNGLDRSADSPDLVALGRSITEPAIQQLYRQYAVAIATLVEPAYLGLAAETNLIRLVAPASLYGAVVQMTTAAAGDIRAAHSNAKLYVSVQVDAAWGRLTNNNTYLGVETDFQDFPFIQALGYSSYPYFVFPAPEDIPGDYYARLTSGHSLPVMVVEGGWSSGSVGTIQSSADLQTRYIRRQSALLDSAKAIAVFQLNFTDLDLASFPPQPPGSILPLFAQLGLVDIQLHAKPALAVWDSVYARPRSQ